MILFRALPWLIFLVSLIVYLFTSAPGLMFTDSGELSAVMSTLGIAHPTGYPLMTLIGFAWTKLPLPLENVQKLNILAGVITAFSAMMFYLANLELHRSISKSASDNVIYVFSSATSLFFAFTPVIWQQGTSIEVYSMHLLFMNSIIYLVFKSFNSGDSRYKYLLAAALLLGLSFTNHLTTILIVPSLIFIFFKSPDEALNMSTERFKKFLLLFIPIVLAGTLYLYLPIRSAMTPEFDWGGVSRGYDKFMYHVQGKQYQVWMFSGEQLNENIALFFSTAAKNLHYAGILLFLFGFKLLRRNSSIAIFIFLLIIICASYSVNYSIHDIDSYFSPAYIGIFLIFSVGIYFLIEKKSKYKKFVWLVYVFPLISLAMNYNSNDESDNILVPEFTKNALNSLDSNAIIISSQWDYWNSAFWYQKSVEGIRKDVDLICMEILRRTWYPVQLKRNSPDLCEPCLQEIAAYEEILEKFESKLPYEPRLIQMRFEGMLNCIIDKNYNYRPIYITSDVWQKEPNVAGNYSKIPSGFALQLVNNPIEYQNSMERLDLDYFLTYANEDKHNHLEEGIVFAVSMNLSNIARYAQFNGEYEDAIEAYSLALELEPTNQYALQGLREIKSIK